jgi:hypothetical protein
LGGGALCQRGGGDLGYSARGAGVDAVTG